MWVSLRLRAAAPCRRQQVGQPVVARRHAFLHAGLEDRIARLPRLVAHRLRDRGPAALLDQDERPHGLSRVPGLVEPLGRDEPLGHDDFAVDAAHPHLGSEMGMGGVYREIVVPERLVTTERFDEAWYPGEAVGTLVLVEQRGRTTVTQTMRYESREARDAVLKSGMEKGVAASYDRLADLLAATRRGSTQS